MKQHTDPLPPTPPASPSGLQEAARTVATGAGVGMTLAVPMNPLEVLKTRMQARPDESIPHIWGKMRQEGLIRSFSAGMRPAMGVELAKGAYRPLLATKMRPALEGALPEEMQGMAPYLAIPMNALIDTGMMGFLERMKVQQMTGVRSSAPMTAGFGALWTRQSIFFATVAGSQEGKELLMRDYGFNQTEATFAGSFAAGFVSTVLGTPPDVVKTRQQAGDVRPAWEILSNVVQQQGIRGTFKGLVPRIGINSLSTLAITAVPPLLEKASELWNPTELPPRASSAPAAPPRAEPTPPSWAERVPPKKGAEELRPTSEEVESAASKSWQERQAKAAEQARKSGGQSRK